MRKWTNEELKYLESSWGNISIPSIANKLNRSVNAVNVKAHKIGLGNFIEQGDYITFHQLINTLGLQPSSQYLEQRLVKLNFPFKTKKIISKRIKIVYLDEFWKWCKNNKNKISFANFEKNALGLEPEWVDDKRKADAINPTKRNGKRLWTKEDEKLLIQLTKSCKYTYRDLAKRFNRTENAIKRKLYDLKVPYRPVPLNNHIKWTKEENTKMLELYNKGFDTHYIATVLGKTQLSISDRLKRYLEVKQC